MRNGALAIILLAAAGVAQRRSTEYINPVIPGDHPDPSLIRVGSSYWATSTSGEWAPVFPLLHSEDLVNWTTEGFVLPEPPAWSAGRYWAPEISEYQGQFYVYYAARKKNGPLCVAVAKSAKPEGPYTDYGPIVCQDDGSIDPMAVVDDNGHRYLIWKEDGNSRGGPTPIWAQELSDDGTKLTGERTELIRNDAPWEGPVVEGPFILRRHGYFYLFYSGAVCCGSGCNYQMGVARSEHLLGPWKKDPDNPILAGTDVWKCPGHGSIVEDPTGRDYLLYHGYNQAAFLFLGREALLDEVKWNRKEWPVINGNKGPSNKTASPFHTAQPFTEPSFHDQFEKSGLNPRWQWPWNNEPLAVSGGGWLTLRPNADHAADPLGAVLAVSPVSLSYTARIALDLDSVPRESTAGLTAYANGDNALGIAVRDRRLIVWRRMAGVTRITTSMDAPAATLVFLRMTVLRGRGFRFAFSADGARWTNMDEDMSADSSPWNSEAHIALTCGGSAQAAARFRDFQLDPAP